MLAFTPHTHNVTALSFSADGAQLASVSTDSAIKVWGVAELGTAPPLWEVDQAHRFSINHCQYARFGNVLFTGGSDGLVKAWDARNGRLVAASDPRSHPEAACSGVNAFVLSWCGKFVVYGGGSMWEKAEFVVARADDLIPVHRVPGHGAAVGVFVAHEHGFASGSADATVRLWSWDSITLRGLIRLRGVVRGLACSRDGSQLATAGGALIHRYTPVPVKDADVDGTVRAGDFRGHTKRVECIEFSPDGTRLASASEDGTVRVWDTASGNEIRAFAPRLGPLHWVTFAPDGLTLAFSSRKGHVGLLDMDA